MERKFSCCKKELNNYVCVGCKGIFHVSCLNRTKKMIELDGCKVYCSMKCEKETSDKQKHIMKLNEEIAILKNQLRQTLERNEYQEIEYKENIDILKSEILKLRNDIREREEYCKKEKRKLKDIEDEALEMEEKFLTLNQTLTERNKNLIESLKSTENQLCLTENLLLSTKAELNKQQVEYEELMKLNKEIVSNMKLLEMECETLNKKLINQEKLPCEKRTAINILENIIVKSPSNGDLSLSSGKDSSSQITLKGPHASTCVGNIGANDVVMSSKFDLDKSCTYLNPKNVNDANKISNNVKHKILLIGDETVTNLSSYVKNLGYSNYAVQGIAMPKIDLETLSKLIFSHSMKYGENDLIICSFKTLNISNYKSLYISLKNILPVSKLVNVILISERSLPGDEKIEQFIHKKVCWYNRLNRNIPIEYFYDIRNIRGFLKKLLKSSIPQLLNQGPQYVALKYIKLVTTAPISKELNISSNSNSELTFFRDQQTTN